MPPTSTSLPERWPLRALLDVRDDLLAAWDRPGYHDLRHLGEVLDRLDDLDRAGAVFDRVPVVLAAWFHDAVYDGRPDAEERSALLAEARLPDPPAAEVARLVRMTEHHQAFSGRPQRSRPQRRRPGDPGGEPVALRGLHPRRTHASMHT